MDGRPTDPESDYFFYLKKLFDLMNDIQHNNDDIARILLSKKDLLNRMKDTFLSSLSQQIIITKDFQKEVDSQLFIFEKGTRLIESTKNTIYTTQALFSDLCQLLYIIVEKYSLDKTKKYDRIDALIESNKEKQQYNVTMDDTEEQTLPDVDEIINQPEDTELFNKEILDIDEVINTK